MKLQKELCNLAFLTLLAFVTAGTVLIEKPSNLNPCKISDASFGSCFAKNLHVMFNEWKDGVPGTKSIDPIDPLAIKHVAMSTDPNGQIVFNVDMQNVIMKGLSSVIIKDVSFNHKKMLLKYKMFLPKLDVNADYELKGIVLNFPLNGKGKAKVIIDKSLVEIAIRLKPRQKADFTFMDIEKLHLDVSETSAMHMQLDNLFNGDKILGDSANAFLNENWRAMYEVGRPGFNKALETVYKDHMSRVLAYVPSNYLFEDFNV